MTVSDVAAEARRALGRQLAALRQAAGHNQHQLAHLVGYARSTVANVEVGRQNAPHAFWERCDKALDTDGALLSGWVEVDRLRKQQRLDEARAARAGLAPDIELSSLVGVYL